MKTWLAPSHWRARAKIGHMEKQETEMKQKLEMETGNENWKQEWEQKCTNHWCNVFYMDSWVVCLVKFYLAMVIWLALLCLNSCTVLCDHCFSVIECCSQVWFMYENSLVTRLVTIWPWALSSLLCFWSKASILLLQPRSYTHFQYVKQIMGSYPGPILHKHLGTIAPFPTTAPPPLLTILANAEILEVGKAWEHD